MEKVRVYELAKELNTTSKRLMEKLAEINIVVKNHMSLLEDHELGSLYKHIGIVKHDDTKKSAVEEKRVVSPPPPKVDSGNDAKDSKDPKKDKKSAPRIIRTTEIIIDTKNEGRDMKAAATSGPIRNDMRGDIRGDIRGDGRGDIRGDNRGDIRGDNRGDIRNGARSNVRSEDANSGLRPGYMRDSRSEYKKDSKPFAKSDNINVYSKEAPKEDLRPELRQEVKNIQKSEVLQETRHDIREDVKAAVKVEEVYPKNENIKAEQQEEVRNITVNIEKEEKTKTNEPVREVAHKEVESKPDSSDHKAAAPVIEQADKKVESAPVSKREPEDRPQSADRPQGGAQGGNYNRPYGDRPQGGNYNNRPYGDRPPQGDRPQGGNYNRPYGDRPQQGGNYNNRPYGDRPPQGDRPQGGAPQGGNYNRPYGDRPQGDRPQGDRPQGGNYNRPYGDRPQGDRPQGGNYNRPYGDRPQGDRPQGGAPQGGNYNRPYGDRPQGGAPQGDRPPFRPYGDRPQGDRPQGDRPPFRPYGDRPQGDRPQGDRPPYGDRPQYNRPYGDRPQGDRPQGDRPQGGNYNRPYGDCPQGGNFQNRGPRPGGDRMQGGPRQGGRPLEIPKVELSASQKEELGVQRSSEARREAQNKDVNKDVKREQKREVPKGQAAERAKRFKPQGAIMGEKKGVTEVLSEEFILNEFYSDDPKKAKKQPKFKRGVRGAYETKHIPHRAVLTSIKILDNITVKDLAESLKKTSTEVIKKLMVLGMMATLNQEVDFDTATLVAAEFGVKTEKAVVINEEDILFDETEEAPESLVTRPPVVVVMGHVDHGKTSLLDAIRETNVIESEAGGITQHIGAYMVKINNRNITFLDTPGHEAFTAMRARGAQVTDIAILVVAADDGVMPQTIEAINHAKAANVAIIVAINKIDKPGANPDKVKQELTEHGIVAEEWGGDAIMVPLSAKKRINIDHLLEMVILVADMQELKSNPDKQAKGTVIEAKLDKGRGPVATVLVQRGTLNVGDSVVTGTTVGRIRGMIDDKGHKIKKAGPSTPVEIIGLPEVPEAGEIFYAITDEKVAKQLAEKRKLKQREQTLRSSAMVSLEDLYNQIKAGKVKDINLIVKADVQGSVEAVKQSLVKLSNDEVRVRIIHDAVGAITESDVTLAQVSGAIIIGFNVRPGTNVTELAENAGVDMRLYRVIYNAIEDVQAAMKGMLEPTFKEVIQGHTEVRQIFKVSGVGTIAGCYVTDGKIVRNTDVRLVRNGIVVHEGKLASLKRFKDDAKEVAQGFECGLSIEKFNELKEGDIVESFVMEEVAR